MFDTEQRVAIGEGPASAHAPHHLIARADGLHAIIGRTTRELFQVLTEIEASGAWRDDGSRDLAHWIQIRYGVSAWKACRWVEASHALGRLPRVARALEVGELGIDKVVELARFAEPDTEQELLTWASTVSAGAIRRRAELETRRPPESSSDLDRERRVRWWLTDEGRRMELMAELPVADGARVVSALERVAADLSEMPGEERTETIEARRADALVALCSGSTRRRNGAAVSRPRIIVHAPLRAFTQRDDRGPNAELGADVAVGLGGGVIDAPTLRRLACDADFQFLLENANGEPLRLGRTVRQPTAAVANAVRVRDRECRFPGCGDRRHTEAHHVVWWSRGGHTDIENLVLVCSFHHRLVHEHGWGIRRADGIVRWFRPDGTRYRAGPSPSH